MWAPLNSQTCAQVLDGQAVSGDKAAAADYSTRQAAQQAMDAAAAQESKGSLAVTPQRSTATGGLQSGLPGSRQRGIFKGRSTSLKHRKSRDVGGAPSTHPEDTSGVVKSNEAAGKPGAGYITSGVDIRSGPFESHPDHLMQVLLGTVTGAICVSIAAGAMHLHTHISSYEANAMSSLPHVACILLVSEGPSWAHIAASQVAKLLCS